MRKPVGRDAQNPESTAALMNEAGQMYAIATPNEWKEPRMRTLQEV